MSIGSPLAVIVIWGRAAVQSGWRARLADHGWVPADLLPVRGAAPPAPAMIDVWGRATARSTVSGPKLPIMDGKGGRLGDTVSPGAVIVV